MIDNLVLTTAHEADSVRFYTQALECGWRPSWAARRQWSARCSCSARRRSTCTKSRDFEPKAPTSVPGALDLCFVAAVPRAEVIARLQAAGVTIIEAPVLRTGATVSIRSVVENDPDPDLIEISEPA